jgi:hypothetical protein
MSLILSGSDGLSDVDGSAATPAIRGTDTNTGIFFPAADTIAFSEGGTEAMRIDGSGNLLVGSTVSNGAKLVVTTSIASPASSGNMNTGYLFQAGDGSQAFNFGNDATGTWYNAAFANNAGVATSYRWLTGGAERMRMASNGDFLLNGTSPFADFTVYLRGNAQAGQGFRAFSNGNFAMDFRNASGTPVGSVVINSGGTAYNTTSDYRLKENIAPMTGALNKIAALKPVTYSWKVDGSASEGFIAHELAEVVPECVTGEKDAVDAEGKPIYQGIDTSFLVATLTAAIQEIKAELDTVKAELATLKA